MASLHQRKPTVAVPTDASRVEENDEDSNGKVIKVADEAPLVKLMRALVPNLGKDLSPCESYIGQYEVYIPLVVFILALITRYYGLTDPAGVVRAPPAPSCYPCAFFLAASGATASQGEGVLFAAFTAAPFALTLIPLTITTPTLPRPSPHHRCLTSTTLVVL